MRDANEPDNRKPKNAGTSMPNGILIAVALGVAIGSALDSLSVGAAIGIAIGITLALNRKSDDSKKK